MGGAPERLHLFPFCRGRHGEVAVVTSAVVVVVVVVVEASAPKVYPRVTLASASTLSGSVVRTLRGGEGLPNISALLHRAWGTSVASV